MGAKEASVPIRAALATVIAILPLSLGHGLASAQPSGSSPGIRLIQMIDAVTGWAKTDDYVLRTTDGGTRWKDVSPPSPSGEGEVRLRDVAFLTPSVGWVVMARGGTFHIFRTVDGGRTWRSAKVSGFGVNSIHFVSPQNGWLIADAVGYMGGNEEVNIFRSTDGGETWIRVASACIQSSPTCKNTPANENSGLPLHGYKVDITFLTTTTGWVTGTILYVTRDAGRTWREQKLPLPPVVASSWQAGYSPPTFFTAQDGILPVFYANDQPTSTVAVTVFYATHDGGSTWGYSAPVSITQGYLDCQHYTCRRYRPSSFADMNHGWLMDRGAQHLTNDGGRQWATVRLPLFDDVRDLQFISPQLGWALRKTSPFLIRTLNGGHAWVPVTYTISPRQGPK